MDLRQILQEADELLPSVPGGTMPFSEVPMHGRFKYQGRLWVKLYGLFAIPVDEIRYGKAAQRLEANVQVISEY